MFLDRIKKLIKTTEHKIRDEKPQYNIYREKYQKYQHYHQHGYEYLTDKELLPSQQSKMIEKAKFTFSLLRSALEKQKKNNWRSRKKTNGCYHESKQKKIV